MALFNASPDPSAAHRLTMIERKLDAIMAQLGIQVQEPSFDEVRTLAQSGRKIEAIKAYREETGVGLAEAKAFVDSLR